MCAGRRRARTTIRAGRRRSGRRRPRSGPPGAPRSVRPARSGSASARARPLGPERPRRHRASPAPPGRRHPPPRTAPSPSPGQTRSRPRRHDGSSPHRRATRLLPQPEQLRGLRPSRHGASPDNLPIADRPHLPELRFDGNPAAFAPSPLVDTNHDRIPGINHIPELVAPFIERPDPTAKELSNARRSVPCPSRIWNVQTPTSHRTSSSKTSQSAVGSCRARSSTRKINSTFSCDIAYSAARRLQGPGPRSVARLGRAPVVVSLKGVEEVGRGSEGTSSSGTSTSRTL